MSSPFYNAIKTCYLSGYWDEKEELLEMAVEQKKITVSEMMKIKELRQIDKGEDLEQSDI
ncbi:hypothetical protein P5490_007955 [Bacillus altitudinis]|uniref:hypothetical protein n=1 Tax=Bacillus altitudinis TaxID=293387 RepID=UPI0037EDAACF|nr:hypothetical protein [Bacillus altitudinis]